MYLIYKDKNVISLFTITQSLTHKRNKQTDDLKLMDLLRDTSLKQLNRDFSEVLSVTECKLKASNVDK